DPRGSGSIRRAWGATARTRATWGRATTPRRTPAWSGCGCSARCDGRGPGSGQEQDDGLGDAGGLGLALDLEGVAQGELLACGEVGDLAHRHVAADPGADPDRVGEADLVDAVVELRAGRLEGEHLAPEEGDQRQREVPVGDG